MTGPAEPAAVELSPEDERDPQRDGALLSTEQAGSPETFAVFVPVEPDRGGIAHRRDSSLSRRLMVPPDLAARLRTVRTRVQESAGFLEPAVDNARRLQVDPTAGVDLLEEARALRDWSLRDDPPAVERDRERDRVQDESQRIAEVDHER